MASDRITRTEFREAMKQLHREFPRPKREQETVGDWALRLFEHQFAVSKLITDYYGYYADGELDEVPLLDLDRSADAINWLLEQERQRRR